MTPCSTILTEEHQPLEDGGAPTHSHRRRWSTPADPGGESLNECFTTEQSSQVSEVSFDDFFSCSSSLSGNGYSFYLGGEMSPWGTAPLLTESRPSAPPRRMVMMETRGEGRRGRSVRRKKDLPPFLTTLDCNGRPRFYHRRVRSEGRLEIARVAVSLPEIVSVRGKEGLRIGTVRESSVNNDNNTAKEMELMFQ